MPVISRGVPALSGNAAYPASTANDNNYGTYWRAAPPTYLAYDLSGVPASRRRQVVVAWYSMTYPYDFTVNKDVPYNEPRDYTLDANPGAGGTYPTSGWVTLATVSGNTYHSRQQLLNLTGYNWLRFSVTAVNGSSLNTDTTANLDVHDASQGVADDWIFYGDSITASAMSGSTGRFAQLINAAQPAYFPVQENGGIGYLKSVDGANHINTWLATFPGRYVSVAYGTNDAIGNVSAAAFYANDQAMVQAILAAGKIPVIPHIPWGCHGAIQQNGPALNAQIDALYSAYPQIIPGPDLWAFFKANPSLISSDCIHPTSAGQSAYRQQYASAMLSAVYGPSASATPTPTTTPTPTPAPTPTPTPAPTPSPTPTPAPSSGGTLFSDNFESDPIGSIPAGWTTDGGPWSVVLDGTHALAAGSTFGHALAGSPNWANYTYSADVRPTALNVGYAGLMGRVKDTNDYYRCMIANDTGLVLVKVSGGSGAWLTSASITVGAGTSFQTLTMQVSGSTISCSDTQNGTVVALVQATDSTFASGGIGVVSNSNEQAEFDNVLVTS